MVPGTSKQYCEWVISREMRKYGIKMEVSGRLSLIRIENKQYNLSIIIFYAPTDTAEKRIKQKHGSEKRPSMRTLAITEQDYAI